MSEFSDVDAWKEETGELWEEVGGHATRGPL